MDETGELSFPYRTIDFYKDSLYKAIDNKIIKKRNLKVVIDYSFGSSAMIFPSVLGKLGCEAVSLNAYVDVNKITRTSEEKHLALKQLSDIVISLKADIGFLIDNCGEKVFLVDEKGHLLPEESAQIVISLLAMRSPTSKNLAVPVNGSGLIDNFAKEYKKVIYRTQTNERAIMEAGVKNPDVTFVAGNCGCYVFPEIQHGFNAMISVAKIVEFLSYEEKSISELHSMIPEHHLLKSTIPCSWKYKGKIMRSLVEKYEKDNIELIDGIKIYKKDGWVLLTPDPETACFHIYTEAKTKKEAEKNIEDHKKMIASWQTED